MKLFRRRTRVFASYSTRDRFAVEPVVDLLRLARGWVFFAPDSIDKGERWRDALRGAVNKCSLMVVFWCEHAGASEWVKREYSMAMDLGKPIVPVRLDDTEMPLGLAEYQSIDFRGAANHTGGRATGPQER